MNSNRAQYQKNWVAAARALRNCHVGEVPENRNETGASCVHHTFSKSDELVTDMELTDHESPIEQIEPIDEYEDEVCH